MKFTDENMEKVKDMLGFAFGPRPMCSRCSHKDVCKYTEETRETCDTFKLDLDYKIYGSIYDLFQPIFDWMKHHYPSGGITFYIEAGKAQMYIEHKVTAFDKVFMDYASTLEGVDMPPVKETGKEE